MMKKIIFILLILINCNISFSQWIYYQLPNKSYLSDVFFVDSKTGFIIGFKSLGEVWKTTTGGESWEMVLLDTQLIFARVHFLNKDTGVVLAGGGNLIYKTTNGGFNWIKKHFSGGCGPSDFDFDSTGYGYITCFCNTLIRTTDYCESFSQAFVLWYNADIICIDVYDRNIAAICLDDQRPHRTWMNFTTNGGVNWLRSYVPDVGPLRGISIYSPNLACVHLPPVIYISQHGLEYFNEYVHRFTFPTFKAKIISDSTIYVVGRGTISKTTNLGISWFEQTSPVNRDLQDVFFVDKNTGYIVGDSGTILKTTNGGVVFAGNNNEILPDKYSLEQNYPNPFNPYTEISFDLPRAGKVKLAIYDIRGTEVKTLVNNEFKAAGKHTKEFNGSNLASGIYFVRMLVNGGKDFTAVRKIVLLK